jgi:CheY-like chemotaxis protein
VADILIVDDDPSDRGLLAEALRRDGHAVRCLPNGRDALGAMVNRPPDLVVTDVYMPQMDGASFVEIVRAYLRFAELPVVVMTAYPDGLAVNRLRELGVAAVIDKDARFLFKALAAVRATLAGPPARPPPGRESPFARPDAPP